MSKLALNRVALEKLRNTPEGAPTETPTERKHFRVSDVLASLPEQPAHPPGLSKAAILAAGTAAAERKHFRVGDWVASLPASARTAAPGNPLPDLAPEHEAMVEGLVGVLGPCPDDGQRGDAALAVGGILRKIGLSKPIAQVIIPQLFGLWMTDSEREQTEREHSRRALDAWNHPAESVSGLDALREVFGRRADAIMAVAKAVVHAKREASRAEGSDTNAFSPPTTVEGEEDLREEARGDVTWGTIQENPPPLAYRVREFEWGIGRPLAWIAKYNSSKTLITKQTLVDYVLNEGAKNLLLGHFRVGSRGTGRVLDLCYEQFEPKAAWLYTRLLRARGVKWEEVNGLIKFGRPKRYLSAGMLRGDFDEQKQKETEAWLCRLVEGFDICNIDPYSVAALGLDESSSTRQEPARLIERVSEATGCAFMTAVHAGRDGDAAKHSRGHSSLDDAFDTTIVISPNLDPKYPNRRTLECAKRPMYGFQNVDVAIYDLNADRSPWTPVEGEQSWGLEVRVVGTTDAANPLVQKRALTIGQYVAKLAPGEAIGTSKLRGLAKLDGETWPPAIGEAVRMGLVVEQPGKQAGTREYIRPSSDEPTPERPANAVNAAFLNSVEAGRVRTPGRRGRWAR